MELFKIERMYKYEMYFKSDEAPFEVHTCKVRAEKELK